MDPCFNPTLVRLRPCRVGPQLLRDHLFQSHAGSIEAGEGRNGGSEVLEFQSHAGSIEAQGLAPTRGGEIEFQSHAGSIEAGSGSPKRVGKIQGFNPTLVRLRLDRWLPTVCPGTRFQSHAGSIEALFWEVIVKVVFLVSIPRWFD